MEIAVAQYTCIPGDISANCALIEEYAIAAAKAGCTAVVFPEMADTGYDFRIIRKSASAWDGMPFQTVKRVSKETGIWMFCGLSERENGHIYNTIAVFNPSGELAARYRKVHLFTKDEIREDQVFTGGNETVVLKIGNIRLGLMICYDLRFPEFARTLALAGADIFVISSAWPASRIAQFTTLVCARAIENQCYVAASNRTGRDTTIAFGGSSCIVDPQGDVLAACTQTEEKLAFAEINLEQLRTIRKSMPVYGGRRPEVYKI